MRSFLMLITVCVNVGDIIHLRTYPLYLVIETIKHNIAVRFYDEMISKQSLLANFLNKLGQNHGVILPRIPSTILNYTI